MIDTPKKYRKFSEKKLLIGTQNPGKIKEFETLLKPLDIQVISLQNTNLADPEETGETFLENALLKARYYSNFFGIPALADDSGFCIEALEQKPGVYSKRFIDNLGGEEKAFKHLEMLLRDENKSANMHCTLALAWPDGHTEAFEGVWHGKLVFPARYANGRDSGFGIDPIFQPHGQTKTSSEDIAYKKKHSHRATALNKLFESCFK
ncbi:MAG: RdgB/HAM1 family non-canonical purine NTP pyrophosphatase [Alphaproteobacteria bacterium]|nr:RdgB/HAM1 family non-canonical purine NTP pyrophosphatase [Alphaproteobacteria bacterium]NCQ67441.1 RdgB/HAM1 family non-canonical purine NTP pyrophosphatase [Alphaproteobacteria bacterium]NCT08060.1 RdgB/HAM1 family non-canonical purine NTP pyrophosphatase [Alphaproteobacteria bacterium]